LVREKPQTPRTPRNPELRHSIEHRLHRLPPDARSRHPDSPYALPASANPEAGRQTPDSFRSFQCPTLYCAINPASEYRENSGARQCENLSKLLERDLRICSSEDSQNLRITVAAKSNESKRGRPAPMRKLVVHKVAGKASAALAA